MSLTACATLPPSLPYNISRVTAELAMHLIQRTHDELIRKPWNPEVSCVACGKTPVGAAGPLGKGRVSCAAACVTVQPRKRLFKYWSRSTVKSR